MVDSNEQEPDDLVKQVQSPLLAGGARKKARGSKNPLLENARNNIKVSLFHPPQKSLSQERRPPGQTTETKSIFGQKEKDGKPKSFKEMKLAMKESLFPNGSRKDMWVKRVGSDKSPTKSPSPRGFRSDGSHTTTASSSRWKNEESFADTKLNNGCGSFIIETRKLEYNEETKNEEPSEVDSGSFVMEQATPRDDCDTDDALSENLFDPVTVPQHSFKHSLFFNNAEDEIKNLIRDLEVEDDPDVHFIQGDFFNYYKEMEILGEGTTGTVKKAQKIATDEIFAIKIVHYRDDTEMLVMIIKEFKNHRRLHHKNIISVYEIYIDYFTKKIYTVMELAECREMFQVIQDLGHYSEVVASKIFKQILTGINYLHSHGVCHRDLKPHNILVSEDGKIVKITDFNVSKFVENKGKKYTSLSLENYKMWTNTGTIAFTAPEVFEDAEYTEAVDMWSLGVVLYTMLCGYQPFQAEYVNELIDVIKKGEFEFHSDPWDGISDLAKDLVKKCLEVNPKKRFTSSDALIHPWIINHGKLPDKRIDKFTDNLRVNQKKLIQCAGERSPEIQIMRVGTAMELQRIGTQVQLSRVDSETFDHKAPLQFDPSKRGGKRSGTFKLDSANDSHASKIEEIEKRAKEQQVSEVDADLEQTPKPSHHSSKKTSFFKNFQKGGSELREVEGEEDEDGEQTTTQKKIDESNGVRAEADQQQQNECIEGTN